MWGRGDSDPALGFRAQNAAAALGRFRRLDCGGICLFGGPESTLGSGRLSPAQKNGRFGRFGLKIGRFERSGPKSVG